MCVKNCLKMLDKDWNYESEVMSSDVESYDSDKIDSDVEAELYSVLHHQQETSLINSEESSTSLNSSGYEERSTENFKCEKAEILKVNNSDDHLEDFNVIQIDESFTSDRTSSCNLFQSFESPMKKNRANFQTKQNTDKYSSSKRKSDLISNVLENIQSNCKKQKKSKQKTSTVIEKTKNVKPDKSVTLNSSDEDSDIIWEDNNETKNHFETNLSQHTIYLGSDSDSTDSWCNKFSNENPHNLKQNKNLKDSWYINDEDLYRYKRSSGRYHERFLTTCTNCNQKGHSPRYCPFAKVLKCFICGNQHKPSKCKKRTCIKCYKMGHDARFCPRNIATCSLCSMLGHSSEECPDLWRRYHLSTSNNLVKSVRYFQDTPLYCYNCGQAGHFGGECIRNRMNAGSYPTWPTVLNYKLPKSARQEFRKKVKKTPNGYRENSFENKPESFKDNFLALSSRKNKRKRKKVKKTSLPSAGHKEDNVQQMDFSRTPKAKQKPPRRKPNSENLLAITEKRAKKRKEKKLRRLLAKQNSSNLIKIL